MTARIGTRFIALNRDVIPVVCEYQADTFGHPRLAVLHAATVEEVGQWPYKTSADVADEIEAALLEAIA